MNPVHSSSDHSEAPGGGRLLAVGDIHGCLQQLRALLTQVAPTVDDRVVFLGDYVDRGPASAGVVEYLLDFRHQFPATVFLRGNHEQMFLDYLAGIDPGMFLVNGGIETLNSYRRTDLWPIPEAHLSFLSTLSLYHETTGHIFVHAGMRPGLPLKQQNPADLMWIRREFIDSGYDWGKVVVFGHTPRQAPLLTESRIGLDTGCVYGRQLTCCDVVTRQIWQTRG